MPLLGFAGLLICLLLSLPGKTAAIDAVHLRGTARDHAFRSAMSLPAAVVADPQTVVGGQSCTCTVTLDSATSSNQAVQIQTDHPALFVHLPSSVVVAAGTTSVTFGVQTIPVAGSIKATFTASCNGGQAQGTVTVTS